MNSKKYEVNTKSHLESPKLSKKDRSPQFAIRYNPNPSSQPSILISNGKTNQTDSNSKPASLNVGSSDNLLGPTDLQRNLSDNTNVTSCGRTVPALIPDLIRNLSQDTNEQKSTKLRGPITSGFSSLGKIFSRKQTRRSDSEHQLCEDKFSSKFYLDGDSVKVNKPFNQGINHSISMNFESNNVPNCGDQDALFSRLKNLTDKDRIELQNLGLSHIKDRVALKKERRNQLKAEIEELNRDILKRNQQIRSTHEIEALRGDIRHLTNEKAKLEMKYSQQSNWECHKCTFSNSFNFQSCEMCNTHREDEEILICYHCGKNNQLSNLSCIGCNAYFNVESITTTREHSLSTSSSGTNNSMNRLFSTNSGNLSSSPSSPNLMPIPVQPSIPFTPTKNDRFEKTYDFN